MICNRSDFNDESKPTDLTVIVDADVGELFVSSK
jgi:hypothetical protein